MRLLAWALVASMAGGYLWFVRKNCSPYASNADASGYLNSARLLVRGEWRVPVTRIPGDTIPGWDYTYQQSLGFSVRGRDGTMVPTYPVGYPLQLAAAAPLVGLDWAAVAVSVVVVGASGLLMLGLGRHAGLPWAWAVAGVAVLWMSPVFLYQALQPMSDVPATAWCLAAMWFGWRARERWSWGLAAGAAAAMAVLVRPTNALILLPLAVLIGGRGRAWLAIAAGGLPGAAFLAWYNRQLYGALVTTGYGDVSWAFGWKYLAPSLVRFGLGLPAMLGPFVVAAALGLVWRNRDEAGPVARWLGTWIAAFGGAYAFYYFSGLSWWSLRFLLPAFPAIILAGLLVVRRWTEHRPDAIRRVGLPVALLAATLGWEWVGQVRLHSVGMKRSEIVYRQAIDWIGSHAPPGTVIVCRQLSGAFVYYSSYPLVRFDNIGVGPFGQALRVLHRRHQPVYAVLFDPEKSMLLDRPDAGAWRRVAQIGIVGIWESTAAP